MCFDPTFNIFTADCHSKPVTQILRGGHYESFGKPHDGLGFVPPMMDHLHGSTAICGLTIVDGPDEQSAKMWAGKIAEACGWPQEVRRFKAGSLQALVLGG